LVTTTTFPAEPPAKARPAESKVSASQGETKIVSPEEAPPKGKGAPMKTGQGTIDMLVDKFGGEVVEVKDTPKASPKKE
jgi:hypothetical protein